MRSCFFLHNPKAGGTSLRQSLIAHVAPEEICPVFDLVPAAYGREPLARLPSGYRLYVGHYGYDLARSVVTDHALISNFRHPAARVVSLYRYFRHSVQKTDALLHDPTYFAVRLAKSADLATFLACEDPRVTTYTADHHFRQLSGDGWSLQSPRSLPEVARLIERLDWLYVCEFPELSQRWGRAVLRAPDLSVGRDNVSSGAALELDADCFRRILDLNPRDAEIHRLAVDRLLRESRGLCARSRPASQGRLPAARSALLGDRAHRPPVPTRGLAAGFVAAVAGLIVLAHPGLGQTGVRLPREPTAAPGAIASLRAHLAQPGAPLDRVDLVTFTRFEATHPAAASADLRRQLEGRRFVVDVPLACGERPPPHASSSARWWYDHDQHTLGLKTIPAVWADASSAAPAALFWITRPKANAKMCPPQIAAKVSFPSLSPTRIGIVAMDLEHRDAMRATPVTVRASWAEVERLAPSLQLHIEGRIVLPQGRWASACRPVDGGRHPDCVLFANIDRLSLRSRDAAANPYSDWRRTPQD